MKKMNFLTKAFTLLFVMLFNLTGARAIVTHTVYQNGTVTNTIVPVDGSEAGSYYGRSQFIIPKDQLAIMAGGKITNMYFHSTQDVVNWYGNNVFDVYVKEVDASTLDSYESWNSLTRVFSGKIAINGHQLIIDFDAPFPYTGTKNLLIGFRQTSLGRDGASTFYGATVNGASVGGYTSNSNNNGTATQRNFIPRTTFVYTPGFIPTNINVEKEIVQVTTIEGDPYAINATLSWEGDADRYEVRYRTRRPLYSQDFSSNASGWTIRKGSNAYGDGWIRESNATTGTNWHMASYSWHSTTHYVGTWPTGESTHIYDADNWLITPQVELGGILKYDCDVSAWHDIYEVRVSTTGIAEADFTEVIRPLTPGIPGTQDYDLKDYSGQKGYIAFHHKNTDGYWLDIDNVELSAGHLWKYATTETNSVVLPHLLPDLVYEYVVVGIKHDAVNNVDVRGETPNYIISASHVDDIIIPDDEDNESLVYDVASTGNIYNAFLENRSFADNGIWNTLTLPFDVTVADSPFKDALIYTVRDRSSYDNNGILTLRIDPLEETGTLKAGTPYLITWEGEKGLKEPFFPLVKFKNETHPVTGGISNGTSIVFTPNFKLLTYTAEDESILFLNDNHLYHVGDGSRIKPQRAYFQVSGGNGVKGIAFEIGGDDADGINDVNANLNGNENIYNVAGQRMGQMQKGINIVNGKKIIIK